MLRMNMRITETTTAAARNPQATLTHVGAARPRPLIEPHDGLRWRNSLARPEQPQE